MILSDATLRARLEAGSIIVEPLTDGAIQPAGIDLHLGDQLRVRPYGVVVDPEVDQSGDWQDVPLRSDGRWGIAGNRLYLGVTAERVVIPADCAGILSGVSSLGRLGIQIHITAGWLDPGFQGRPTLELILFGEHGYLRQKMRIAQLSLITLDQQVEKLYSGRYQNDVDVAPSRSFLDLHHES